MLAALAVVALSAAPVVIEAGPLTFRLHRSEGAQIFHVVDHLSAWHPFSHKQYAEELARDERTALTDKDKALLAEHAALRRRLGGWGSVASGTTWCDDVSVVLPERAF